VIRRSQQVIAPGKFCFSGGGIEPAATEQQALRRELAEQLGVAIKPIAKLWESLSSRQLKIHWWSADFDPPRTLKPNPEQVAAIYWMTRDELLSSEELLDGNQAFLEQPQIARPSRSDRC
jgi:8-oxo-dGTP pyrophosphatase MutT (NUDIX family)